MNWLHIGSVTFTSFLASLVEFVEALTILLAVGTTRGWRSTLWGALAAVLALTILILVAGPSIQLIPIHWLQLVIGGVVAIFGLRWLKKATLRSAGYIPFHDEDLEFAKQIHALQNTKPTKSAIDKVAFITSFKGVFLEGVEVAFIVITAGSVSGGFASSLLGAVLALLTVIILGLLIHRPLTKIPENTLKKTVGILLSSFGIFWVGEGLGLDWPLGDLSIVVLALVLTAISLAASSLLASRRRNSNRALR